MPFLSLFRTRKHDRAGHTLYVAAVGAARDPFWYERAGVPDTLDGRFDMVGLLVTLLVRRLRRAERPGPELAQAVFDAMFGDMDGTLRELGVSDLMVGRKVKAMMEAFHGRATAYEAALDASDGAALRSAVGRNVWRGADAGSGAGLVASYAAAQAAALEQEPLDRLATGEVHLLAPGVGVA